MTQILIVEDEIIVAKDIQKKLEKLGYHIIDTATNGPEAIQKAQTHHPDLILMDIRLEGDMDGIQAAETITKKQNIPIIYLTAYGDEATFSRAKITEPYGYILKPFEQRELHSTIEIALYKNRVEQKLQHYHTHLEEEVAQRTKDLKKTNTQLKQEITHRKKAETAALAHKKNLENVIDSATEIIISFDTKHKIQLWNKAAEHLTGYTQHQIIGKTITKTPVFEDPIQLKKNLEHIIQKKPTTLENIILKTKYATKRHISISYSPIQNETNTTIGILLIGRDITDLRETQDNIQTGCSYLITQKDDTPAFELFRELVKRKNKGLLFSRGTIETIHNLPAIPNITHILLSNHTINGIETISEIKEVIEKTQTFLSNHQESIILFQGIHYLLTRFSFEEFINMIFEIRELVSLHQSIFLLKIDPVLFTKQQLAILHHEIQSLPVFSSDNILISEASYDILRFVHEKNQHNAIVTIKDIANQFSIVYRTASKRLDVLKNMGLVTIKKYGRSRGIFITNKGTSIIKQHTDSK